MCIISYESSNVLKKILFCCFTPERKKMKKKNSHKYYSYFYGGEMNKIKKG